MTNQGKSDGLFTDKQSVVFHTTIEPLKVAEKWPSVRLRNLPLSYLSY